MNNLIELRKGEHPASGTPIIDRVSNRTSCADDIPHDIALIVGRATIWAADNCAETGYLRRDS
jgi:hypothetical protein